MGAGRRRRRIAILVILVFAVGLLAVWAPEPTPIAATAHAQKSALPYKIGVTVSQTGPFCGPPKIQSPGFEAVMKDANRKGGVNGHLLEFIYHDSESDSAKSVANYRRAAETDKVHAVWGSGFTGTSMALAAVADEVKCPVVASGGSSVPDKPVRKWFFRPNMTERDEIRPLLRAFRKVGVSKLAALTQGAAYGQGGLVAIREEAPGFGLDIVIEQTYDPLPARTLQRSYPG